MSTFWVVSTHYIAFLCCAIFLHDDAEGSQPASIVVTERTVGVRWTAPTGSRSGLIAADQNNVLVATNEIYYGPDGNVKEVRDGGSLICLDRATGKRKWQRNHPRRDSSERGLLGIQSLPKIVNGNVYYVSNRGELCCASMKDGSDLWTIDMISELDICFSPDFAIANPFCSPLIQGDRVFCVTGNGCTFSSPQLFKKYQGFVPKPNSPHFICVDRRTGKVLWSSAAPGKNVVYSWSSPVGCRWNNHPAIAFPGGDGVLYFMNPENGAVLHSYSLNSPNATDWSYSQRGSQLFFSAPPAVLENRLYIGVAQDFSSDTEAASLVALDLAARPTSDSREVWAIRGKSLGSSHTTPAIKDDCVFVFDQSSFEIIAIDRGSGRILGRQPTHDAELKAFNSITIVGDRLIVVTGTSIEVYEATEKLVPIRKLKLRHGQTAQTGTLGQLIVDGESMFLGADSHVFAMDSKVVLGE